MMLATGADIEEKGGPAESTALHLAASRGHEAVVRLLLEHGADFLAKRNDGVTPLHLAASFGRAAIVRLLVENGADVSAKADMGKTPEDEWTPLHSAASEGRETVARILIGMGAGVSAKSKRGLTAEDVATASSQHGVAKMLRAEARRKAQGVAGSRAGVNSRRLFRC